MVQLYFLILIFALQIIKCKLDKLQLITKNMHLYLKLSQTSSFLEDVSDFIRK